MPFASVLCTQSIAPGKVILFGEHAVVYGRPAIAVPVTQVQAVATVEDSQRPGVRLLAPDLGLEYELTEAAADDPLAHAVRLVQRAAGLASLPSLTLTVQSTIPIAGGMGSGADTAAATIRALALHLGRPDLAQNEPVSALTYQVEQLHHGIPSGIDNTVVTYGRPVYFARQQPMNRMETFTVATPLRLLIGDTGVRSSTKEVVEDVRRRWEADPERLEALFDGCGRIAVAARLAIEQGDLAQLGQLMNENQRLLAEMTVSSPELDRLVEAAVIAGAWGAKLSGAGRGGNMIALVAEEQEVAVQAALLAAGARAVYTSILK